MRIKDPPCIELVIFINILSQQFFQPNKVKLKTAGMLVILTIIHLWSSVTNEWQQGFPRAVLSHGMW